MTVDLMFRPSKKLDERLHMGAAPSQTGATGAAARWARAACCPEASREIVHTLAVSQLLVVVLYAYRPHSHSGVSIANAKR